MIELRINNESLDLDDGTSVTLEENNPAFASDALQGSFSVPFQIPASPKNSKLFGFPEVLELSRLPKLRYKAELWVEGLPFKSGEIIFRSVSKSKYTINFQAESSLLTKNLNDVKLQDLNHTDITLVDFNSVSGGLWGSYNGHKILKWNMANSSNLPNPFKVKVNEKDFEDPSSVNTVRAENVIDQINAYTEETGVSASVSFSGGGISIEFKQVTAGIDAVLEAYLYDYTYWTPDPDRFWITKYEALFKPVIDGFANNNYPAQSFVFPTIKNESLYAEKELNESSYINYFVDTEFLINSFDTLNFTTDVQSPSQYSLCPFFYLKYVFDKIAEKAGITFIGAWINDPDIERLVIYNNHTIDHFEKVYNKDYNYYHNVIKPGNHLPAITANEFILAVMAFFRLTFRYDQENNTLEFIPFKNVLLDRSFVDITNRTNPAFEFEFNEPEGITFNYKFESKDTLYKTKLEAGALGDLAPYILGEGVTKRETTISTLYSNSQSEIKVPYTLHPGGPTSTDFTFRLLSYYGLQPGQSDDYLFASFDDTRFDGTVLSKYSLAWQGDKGLYKVWHDVPAEFDENTQLVKWESYFNINDLINFLFERKLRINGISYLVKKISYTVSLIKGLQPVKLELYKADV